MTAYSHNTTRPTAGRSTPRLRMGFAARSVERSCSGREAATLAHAAGRMRVAHENPGKMVNRASRRAGTRQHGRLESVTSRAQAAIPAGSERGLQEGSTFHVLQAELHVRVRPPRMTEEERIRVAVAIAKLLDSWRPRPDLEDALVISGRVFKVFAQMYEEKRIINC